MFAIRCAVIAFALCLVSTGTALAQQYFVNGQRVSANRYNAWRLIGAAQKLMHANEADKAAHELQRALLCDPTLAEAHSNLGVALGRLGRVDEAAEHFRMAIVDNKNFSGALLNLASLYQSSGKMKDALDAYNQFIKEYPDSRQVPAVQERIELLSAEIKRQSARTSSGTTDQDYFANIVSQQGEKKWAGNRMPLRVHITDGEGLNGYQSQYDKILRDSFAEWQNASNGRIKFKFVSRPSEADITCRWLDDPEELASSAEGGEAEVLSIAGAIVRAKILLLVKDQQAFPLTDNLIRILCLHEVGHALGLLGHSIDVQDVLFCTTPLVDREQHLSARDKNTIQALYRNDLDMQSKIASDIDRASGGKTDQLLRLGQILLIALAVLLLVSYGIYKAVAKPAKKPISPK